MMALEEMAANPDFAATSDNPAILRAETQLWRAVAASARRALYVWGAGSAGRAVAAAIGRRGGIVTAFVESTAERAGQRIDSVPIISASELARRRGDGAAFVVVASMHAAAIARTLREMAWPESDLLIVDSTAASPVPPVAPAPVPPPPPVAAATATGPDRVNGLGQTVSYARALQDCHLANCRVLAGREEILSRIPAHGTVAEIGTLYGYFARAILRKNRPSTLHILDIDMSRLDRAALEEARGEIAVHLHEGDSVQGLESFPDGHFDWIYIDGDHSEAGVRRDAYAAMRKIRPEGFLVFNDYTPYSPLELCPYGTMHVVHELCLDHGFEIVYLALHGLGYHDVALRRRGVTT